MRDCYIELADHPFPVFPKSRHHALKGKLRDFWEYEVGGGERVRYKRGGDDSPLVVYAGPAPSDTQPSSSRSSSAARTSWPASRSAAAIRGPER